ncbi:uncharacterized protein LOC115746507 [Rhodamnia argentea]|uniref:Uncharacterized protein LOC115746507 n=1 Tax=Rhodamnia argentea TaxID=178133 RepID=A0A8B8PTS5_9MYRT|nr:uncharacterized protein LOC115746507 [Rhodamnia argentea]
MGSRRFAQFPTSDDDEEDEPHPPGKRVTRSSKNPVESEADSRSKRRKLVKLVDEDEDGGGGEPEADREGGREEKSANNAKRRKKKEEEEEEEEEGPEEEVEEEEPDEDAKPIGDAVRFSGKGRGRKSHYEAFELDGNQYELEDPVLLVPAEKDQKPYVAIIKDIAQTTKGSIMVTGQWFYRPEEAEKKGGGSWQSRDTRELFYSFHRDEVPAESVMHKCVVHFVPIHKQLPHRKQNPGFIVQKVYDTVEKKLWKLTDKDYEDNKQHEIDLLVQKTMQRLVDLPDIDTEDAHAEQEDQLKRKRSFRRRNVSPLDVSRDEDSAKSDQHFKAETPGSCTSNASEYYAILVRFNELTGESARDKWLERLLQAVQYVCISEGTNDENGTKCSEGVNGSQEQQMKGEHPLIWPDAAVSAVTALEKASHQTFSSDFQKYNQKLRQLLFNLKNNALLARRLLKGELEPSKILNMSPIELKEGLTAEETARNEPEESERMQMTDARCSRCSEFKVGVRDIIQAGHGDRYQLECIACGHSWYASRDAVSMLTIDGPSSTRSVGTAPWATTKFESVEKQLASPRESTKPPDDAFKKSTEVKIPVLERQKSISKSKLEDNSEITTK